MTECHSFEHRHSTNLGERQRVFRDVQQCARATLFTLLTNLYMRRLQVSVRESHASIAIDMRR